LRGRPAVRRRPACDPAESGDAAPPSDGASAEAPVSAAAASAAGRGVSDPLSVLAGCP
jgi:hypothetical protein